MTDRLRQGSSAQDLARAEQPVAPISTYRLQLNHRFTFDDGAAIVSYLSSLGIGAAYTSPFMLARPGSLHGYDIADHNRVNPELGGDEGLERFVAALHGSGLTLVADFVPNHMGIDPDTNVWWREVLENGPCSRHARFFDIDWDPASHELKNKVLLPILEEPYGVVLERGDLRLAFEDGQVFVHYGSERLPINPGQQTIVLGVDLDALRAELGDEDRDLREFQSILTGLNNLPPYTESDPARIEELAREKEILRERLMRLLSESEPIQRYIDRTLDAADGEAGRPESFDLLHDLLDAQPYRLAYWRTALHEINYRRFFDVNDLAGVRVEDPEVFAATHALIGRLVGRGWVTALRIDHPDGLFDPAEYFARVQTLAITSQSPAVQGSQGPTTQHSGTANPGTQNSRTPGLWDPGTSQRPLWCVVEKVLAEGEKLPRDWAVDGTTGYSFLNDVNGLFVHPDGLRSLRRIYGRLTGRSLTFDEIAYRSKKTIIETTLASELNVLADALKRIANGSRRSRDFTLNSLRDLLTEVVACFPVYRTYISPRGWTASDEAAIDSAIGLARRHNPAMERSLFDFLRGALLPSPDAEDRDRRMAFAMKFQQYTGPVQAKGLEDTAFYRYNVLVSVNEVGGHPSRAARTPDDFHRTNTERLADWPAGMLATATHDTKLGEDVRARIDVLTEIPDEWRRAVARWTRLTAGMRVRFDSDWAPARPDEYRFYQVLAGCWPMNLAGNEPAAPELVARMRQYMTKATKEAKVHTSWIAPNQTYDEAMAAFVDRVLAGSAARRFLPAFVPLARRIARIGAVNSLSQTLLKLASPGVPDFYQGSELWSLTLVDPDNRQPVDYALRTRLLEELEPHAAALDCRDADRNALDEWLRGLLTSWADGRVKLWLTALGLRMRRQHPALFTKGEYLPLACESTVPAGLVALARRLGDDALMAIAPRLVAPLMADDNLWPVGAPAWATSRVLLPPALAERRWTNALTGRNVPVMAHPDQPSLFVADALRDLPVALLRAVPESHGPGS
jgi:(1->4)-alpha-D-glucan 1-alpha-D-glucosylmutase